MAEISPGRFSKRFIQCASRISGIVALALIIGATGCKSQQQRDAEANARSRGQVSDNRGSRASGKSNAAAAALPSPNFNGPNVIAPPPVAVVPPPAPAPVAPPPVPHPEPQQPLAQAGVPRTWVPNAPARPWKWIVIHHSATPAGSAAVFDKEHKEKGWDGLGYDFVIGNGTDSGNGQVEVGYRWTRQLIGAHAKTADNQFNERGVGICLVGNFDVDRPTQAQIQSLTKLVTYLMRTYRIPASGVLGHRETKPTDCPGRNINVAAIRRAVSQSLAATGQAPASPDEENALAAGITELLVDQPTR
jgi:N-acetylmuramoyl-L-alanine amidase